MPYIHAAASTKPPARSALKADGRSPWDGDDEMPRQLFKMRPVFNDTIRPATNPIIIDGERARG